MIRFAPEFTANVSTLPSRQASRACDGKHALAKHARREPIAMSPSTRLSMANANGQSSSKRQWGTIIRGSPGALEREGEQEQMAPPIHVDAAVGLAEEDEPEHTTDLPDLVQVDGQDPSAPPRRRRVHVAEAGTQTTDEWDIPDWTRVALGRAKRVLQRLHFISFQQPTAQLSEFLQAACMTERV